MKKVEESVHPPSTEGAPNLTMADFARVLVPNVVLAIAIVVLVFLRARRLGRARRRGLGARDLGRNAVHPGGDTA